MEIYDTHAHLDHLDNLDEALQSAREAGVIGIVAMSMDLASSRKTLEIKQSTQSPAIYMGMGMHPSETNLDELDACLDLIRTSKDELHVVGEIGLDFWYKWVRKDKEKKDAQRKAYRAFLEVALEVNLPTVIHSRGCWRECFETARELGIKRAEFHWYSGPLDVLEDIIKAGYYVSTSPSVAYSPQSREAMSAAPIEQTLIETDCPVHYRISKESDDWYKAEPKDVFKTLKAYSELKGIEQNEALDILNQNARQFFGI